MSFQDSYAKRGNDFSCTAEDSLGQDKGMTSTQDKICSITYCRRELVTTQKWKHLPNLPDCPHPVRWLKTGGIYSLTVLRAEVQRQYVSKAVPLWRLPGKLCTSREIGSCWYLLTSLTCSCLNPVSTPPSYDLLLHLSLFVFCYVISVCITLIKTGMVVHICNPRTHEAKVRGSHTQGQPDPYRKRLDLEPTQVIRDDLISKSFSKLRFETSARTPK
jgi:hypothetical protein